MSNLEKTNTVNKVICPYCHKRHEMDVMDTINDVNNSTILIREPYSKQCENENCGQWFAVEIVSVEFRFQSWKEGE